MYTIIKADIKDIETLVKLWKDTFKQAYNDLRTPENLDSYCSINFNISLMAMGFLSHGPQYKWASCLLIESPIYIAAQDL